MGVAWPSGGFRHHTSVLNRGRRGIPHGVVPHTAWYPTRRGIPCGAVPHGLVFHTARRGIAYGVVSHVDKRWRSCVRERCFHHASSAAHHSLPTRGHAMGYEVRVVRGIAPALRSMLGRHLSPELQTKRTQSGAWLPIVLLPRSGVSFSGEYVATASIDTTIKVWRVSADGGVPQRSIPPRSLPCARV